MRSALAVLVVGAGLAAGAVAADAAYLFGFGQASYDLLPGQTYQVPIYIQETGSTSLHVLGLVGAGVVVQQGTPSETPVATFDATTVLGTDAFAQTWVLAASDYPTYQWAANNATAVEITTVTDPLYPVTAATDRIQLGWIGFTAGNLPGSTVFQAVPDPEADLNLLGDSETFISVDPASVRINVVPEPVVFGLLGSCAPALLYRRRTR